MSIQRAIESRNEQIEKLKSYLKALDKKDVKRVEFVKSQIETVEKEISVLRTSREKKAILEPKATNKTFSKKENVKRR